MQTIIKYHPRALGGVTITMSLLLLVLVLGATVYTANSKRLDSNISQAAYRKEQAYTAAEAGIAHALAHLASTMGFIGTLDQIEDDKFSVSVSPTQGPVGTEYALPSSPRIRFRTITATGYSSDKTSTSYWHSTQVIEQKVYLRPIAGNIVTAITVAGILNMTGNFKVAANPNGGGDGVPLSIWSAKDVKLSGNGATCALQEFEMSVAQDCDSSSYSDKSIIGTDIIENDLKFPDDLLRHIFSIPKVDFRELKARAKYHQTDCTQLGPNSVGIYWISEHCDIVASVGTASNPVIIIVENGSIKLSGNDHVHGIVYSLYVDTTLPAPEVRMTGTAQIKGALLIDSDIEQFTVGLKVRYSPAILNTISSGDHPEFSSLNVVTGSWKDFWD